MIEEKVLSGFVMFLSGASTILGVPIFLTTFSLFHLVLLLISVTSFWYSRKLYVRASKELGRK